MKYGFGVTDGYDFADDEVNQDIKQQHIDLHEHQLAHGIRFPPRYAEGGMTNPVWDNMGIRKWGGSWSPAITRHWLDEAHAKTLSPKEAAKLPRTADSTLETAHQLDHELSQAPALKSSVYVYSGISSHFGEKLKAVKPNSVHDTIAPISSSISPGIAWGCAARHVMSIHLPEGSKPGLYIGKLDHGYEGEGEFTLKRNSPLLYRGTTTFKINNERESTDYNGEMNTGYVHHFEYLPEKYKW